MKNKQKTLKDFAFESSDFQPVEIVGETNPFMDTNNINIIDFGLEIFVYGASGALILFTLWNQLFTR